MSIDSPNSHRQHYALALRQAKAIPQRKHKRRAIRKLLKHLKNMLAAGRT